MAVHQTEAGWHQSLLNGTAIVGVCLSVLAGAGTPALAEAPASIAGVEQTQNFSIASQPLVVALDLFADQTGVSFAYKSDDLKNLSSPGVEGNLTTAQALQQLLNGTGVLFQFSGVNTVSLTKLVASEEATLLDTVFVQGESASPLAADGYVARRSLGGTKTGALLIETPQSISVVTRDQMDARAVQNIGEAVQYTAGVQVNRRGESSGLAGSNIVIRGFGGDGTAGASSNEYVDGLRITGTNFASAGFEPYLYERIEVLKGPSSVLYGQGTPAGVVNHVSKRPTEEPLYEVQIEAGSFDRFEGAFDLSGPIDADGKFLYRLTGLALDTKAQTNFTSRKRRVIAPALTWQPTEATSLTILANYQEDNARGGFINRVPAYGTILANPNGEVPDDFYSGDPNYNDWDRTMYSIGYQFEHRFNDTWAFRQNTRYLHNDLYFESIFGSLLPDLRTLSRSTFGADETADDVTVDNQLQANFATGAVEHTMLFGVDYQHQRKDTLRRSGSAPNLDIFAPVYYQAITIPAVYQNIEQTSEQVGTYLQNQSKWDKWVMTLGGRYDWADSETKNLLGGGVSNESDSAFTGRAGLGYMFDNGLVPYLSYSESFEPQGDVDFSGTPFEPTTGTQYEVGIKYEPTGYNSLITVSVFQLTQQNVLTADLVNSGYEVQTGEIRSQGVELESIASLGNGLSLTGAYTYLDLEITKSNNGDVGNTPIAVPDHSASLWADYKVGEGDLSGLGLGLGVRYMGSSYGDAANSFRVPSYTVFDASVQY
ncbi:MAG: TonB-dependent siderophore receptor, partial [Parvibaculaceae bacterium]|nr:TonB-dependent siderophore receptor [Parvibaculaceae bacterium]